MFRTQEDLDLVLLQYILEFNETGLESPGVVAYKGYKETNTGVLLETFPLSGTRLSPEGASCFFRPTWEDLGRLAKRLNLWATN